MYKYHLSFEAEEDVIRIYSFGIEQFGITQANKYYEMLFDCFEKIASNPYLFPVVFKYNYAERYCVCGVDTIYYNINDNDIQIITIVGRQELK
jgi:toxin ParE1/3/4